jgi:SAM-dependent methyltransferase
MAEDNSGLKALLRLPWAYEAVQMVMGGRRGRRELAAALRARPGDRVLDIGCGTAILRSELGDVTYVGYEPNGDYVRAGQKMFGDRVSLHEGYFDAAAAGRHAPFDVALVSAVLHHMDDGEAAELFDLLRRCLKPDGRVVTLDNVYVDDQNPVARWLISKDRGRNVRSPEGYAALARPYFARVDGVVKHRAFIPYTHWIMECSGPRAA